MFSLDQQGGSLSAGKTGQEKEHPSTMSQRLTPHASQIFDDAVEGMQIIFGQIAEANAFMGNPADRYFFINIQGYRDDITAV